MGWWQVSADTLAGSRFVLSPMAETTASLITLHRGTAAHPGERGWLDAHRPAYRARLAGDPVTALLVRAALGRTWIADVFTHAPGGGPPGGVPPGDASPGDVPPGGAGESTFASELAQVRGRPPETARADLMMSLDGPLPARLDRDDLPERAADLLEWVWAETVLPYWPQRRRIIEADIVARTETLSHGGWAAALSGLRPHTRWLGEGRLQINAFDYPPRRLSGAQLLFVPITMGRGWVSWDEPYRYAVMYPCTGVLADTGRVPEPQALGVLLGPARARVLVLLDTPKSTTQLVALTGQGLGSVGRHLRVLLDAGLVRRRRAGRSVLYYRTDAGETLLAAQSRD